MKLAIVTTAAILALAPLSAFADQLPSNDTVTAAPQDNPNVDSRTAAADAARQDYYKDKLDAANAKARADSAIADKNAAEDRADQDRAIKHDAEDQ